MYLKTNEFNSFQAIDSILYPRKGNFCLKWIDRANYTITLNDSFTKTEMITLLQSKEVKS